MIISAKSCQNSGWSKQSSGATAPRRLHMHRRRTTSALPSRSHQTLVIDMLRSKPRCCQTAPQEFTTPLWLLNSQLPQRMPGQQRFHLPKELRQKGERRPLWQGSKQPQRHSCNRQCGRKPQPRQPLMQRSQARRHKWPQQWQQCSSKWA